MLKRSAIVLLAIAIAAGASSLTAQTVTSGLRGATPLNEEGPAPPMLPNRNTSEREARNYPEQPPVIPHGIAACPYSTTVTHWTCSPVSGSTVSRQVPVTATLPLGASHVATSACQLPFFGGGNALRAGRADSLAVSSASRYAPSR